jgi:glycosyltransferase involved in cell wall biosynthesis
MISVIIPTYKTPETLDLCLKSAIEGQKNKNQIIVVVDGFYNINKDVLKKWSKDIDILNLEENVGTCRATNLGVFNAQYDKVLIVNDDNVFPQNWDLKLEKIYQPNSCISPNQIEPYPSMFSQFVIKDLGRDSENFNLEQYWEYENNLSEEKIEENGSTFPIFMNKFDFLRIGGFAEDYPSPSGFVADWEFFLKCEMNGMKMLRTYNCNFYHFVSVSAKSPDQIEQSKQYELACHEYFKYKWGQYAKHNPKNNSKLLNIYTQH